MNKVTQTSGFGKNLAVSEDVIVDVVVVVVAIAVVLIVVLVEIESIK